MDMQSSRQLAVTQQQAWDALNDPAVLKLCIPGCDKVEATGPQQYAVGVALKIGPVSAKFAGKITLSDMLPPNSYTLTFDGQGGAAGFGKGTAKVVLTPNADGCELAYTVMPRWAARWRNWGNGWLTALPRACRKTSSSVSTTRCNAGTRLWCLRLRLPKLLRRSQPAQARCRRGPGRPVRWCCWWPSGGCHVRAPPTPPAGAMSRPMAPLANCSSKEKT